MVASRTVTSLAIAAMLPAAWISTQASINLGSTPLNAAFTPVLIAAALVFTWHARQMARDASDDIATVELAAAQIAYALLGGVIWWSTLFGPDTPARPFSGAAAAATFLLAAGASTLHRRTRAYCRSTAVQDGRMVHIPRIPWMVRLRSPEIARQAVRVAALNPGISQQDMLDQAAQEAQRA